MKKLAKVLYSIFGIISLLALFVGFYMMIQSLGKNNKMTLIWMGVFLAGILGFIIIATIIFIRKRKNK